MGNATALSSQELFWLEQEELKHGDTFFIAADTPKRSPKLLGHRKRICKESYERALDRLIQKQATDLAQLPSKIGQQVDTSLLPAEATKSHFVFVPGQQYVREYYDEFKDAFLHVSSTDRSVEDIKLDLDELKASKKAKQETCSVSEQYRNRVQGILDNALMDLQVTHLYQRNCLLSQSNDNLRKLTDDLTRILEEEEKHTLPAPIPPPPPPPATSATNIIHSVNANRDPRRRYMPPPTFGKF